MVSADTGGKPAPNEVCVRTARPADAKDLGEIGYAAWCRGIRAHIDPSARGRVSVALFEAFAAACAAKIVVAERDTIPIGFAGAEHDDNTISDLWVHPDAEGRGVGSALLAELERRIAGRGHDTVEIEVLTANRRALDLYRHHGYRVLWEATREDPFLLVPLHKTRLVKALRSKKSRGRP